MERNAPLGSVEHYGFATNIVRHAPFIGPIVANIGRGIRNTITDILGYKTLTSVVDTVI